MDTLKDIIEKEAKAHQKIRSRLNQYFQNHQNISIRYNIRWGTTSKGMPLDFVIESYNKIIAIIEIKLGDSGVKIAKEKMLGYVMANTSAEFFIIYNISKDSYHLITRNAEEFENVKLDEIASKIINKSEELDIKEKETKQLNNDLRFYECTEKILDPEFCREKLGKSYSFSHICRYSSIESIFSTLKFKTLRMNGLPGMNDKTEGLFAWNLLNKLNSMANEEGRRRKREINNAFIVSFSKDDKEDDLDMWRLYGDDAKGVCCVYSIQKEKIKDRFFLHEIKYIENKKNETDEIDDLHLEEIRKYINQQNELTYSDLSPSIFFYKPYEFHSEEEVRLLVDNKKTLAYNSKQYKRDWVLTNANKIPNPYIDIPLDEIPLKLEKIILGPNMNDIDTIQVQLEAMLEQQQIIASVEPSKIDVYRNPNF